MVASAADSLAPWLAEQLGVRLAGRSPVGGGCIHRAWRLDLENDVQQPGDAQPKVLFAKTNRPEALPLLQAEAAGLAALAPFAAPANPTAPHLPQPLACGLAGPEAVLVLPWFDLSPPARGVAAGWRAMGAALASLHRASAAAAPSEGFGFRIDNFIGASPQRNRWQARWDRFFMEQRLLPQLDRARSSGLCGGRRAALLERSGELLACHQPVSVLVHGDLWSGNVAVLADGRPAVFDPAVYWGDREVDLAMARLFGGFPEAFFAGYEESWPLARGHRARRDLYNLYHLLNHLNLFGSGYRNPVETSIDRLLV
jgi:fructosamine-3-kinase